MDLKFIDDYINKKIAETDEYVRFTFYELRVKSNLSVDETNKFLELAKNKFENMKYEVFFTGDKYTYQNVERVVQDNELMIAIKSN